MNKFTSYAELLQRVSSIDPLGYGRTRNFLEGDVTQLSPYITHGVISLPQLAKAALTDHTMQQAGKLLFQLAWREYFHRIWQALGDDIFHDIKHPQASVVSNQLPARMLDHSTGIDVIDQSISNLYQHGYLHNHTRMWIASLAANIGQSHWQSGAQWMHYHLLDGDLASNTLSWQWIAGTFSNKRYLANQDNLNKYSQTEQRGTFIDVSYTGLAAMPVPEPLLDRAPLTLLNEFPETTLTTPVDASKPLVLYHPFNLDPHWRQQASSDARRILVIEPDRYVQYPLSPARWQFVEYWAGQIPGLEIYVGRIESLLSQTDVRQMDIASREYPLTNHWPGQQDARDWLYPDVGGYFQSFFKFWNVVKKQHPIQND